MADKNKGQKQVNPNLAKAVAFLEEKGYKARFDDEEAQTIVAYKDARQDTLIFMHVPADTPGRFAVNAIVECVEADVIDACISAVNIINAHEQGATLFVTPNSPDPESDGEADEGIISASSVCVADTLDAFLGVFDYCVDMLEDTIQDYDDLMAEMLGEDGEEFDEDDEEGDEEGDGDDEEK